MDAQEQDAINRASQCYLGCARVPIEALRFPTFLQDEGAHQERLLRPLNPANVERLKSIFKCEGLQRHKPENFLKAVIPPGEHPPENFSFHSRTDASFPDLPQGQTLICLTGRHRVEAAKELLLVKSKKWWIVEVYSSELPFSCKWILSNTRSNENRLEDGYIFRNLRRDDALRKEFWLSQFSSESKRACYMQLYHQKDQSLLQAFDDLLDFVGLWATFPLGNMPALISSRCVPVRVIDRINRIMKTPANQSIWTTITLGDAELYQQADTKTVEQLQLLSPRHSLRDCRKIEEAFMSPEFFPGSKQKRKQVKEAVLSISQRIPSLFTFFEDFKMLQPCAKIITYLVPREPQKQLRTRLKDRRDDSGFDRSYIELWLFAMRHFWDLGQGTPKKDARSSKPQVRPLNQVAWARFTTMAESLGFQSLRTSAPCREAQGNDHFQETKHDNSPTLSGDGPEVEMSHRCGRPFEHDYRVMQKYLFYDFVYCEYNDAPKEHATLFKMKRDMVHAFFGSYTLNLSDIIMSDAGMRQPSARSSINQTPGNQPEDADVVPNNMPNVQEDLYMEPAEYEVASGDKQIAETNLLEELAEDNMRDTPEDQAADRVQDLPPDEVENLGPIPDLSDSSTSSEPEYEHEHGTDVPQEHGTNILQEHGTDVPQEHGANVPQEHGTDVPHEHGADTPQENTNLSTQISPIPRNRKRESSAPSDRYEWRIDQFLSYIDPSNVYIFICAMNGTSLNPELLEFPPSIEDKIYTWIRQYVSTFWVLTDEGFKNCGSETFIADLRKYGNVSFTNDQSKGIRPTIRESILDYFPASNKKRNTRSPKHLAYFKENIKLQLQREEQDPYKSYYPPKPNQLITRVSKVKRKEDISSIIEELEKIKPSN